MIERIAQRLWNAESVRAAGRDRLIPWSEVDGPEQEKWRYMAQAVLTELSAGDGVQQVGPDLFPKDYKFDPSDWEMDERLNDWAQLAFNRHWLRCQEYLDAKVGGQQTSRNLHDLCQGYALALFDLARGISQSDRDAAQDYWNAKDQPDEVEALIQAFARHRTLAAAAERARIVARVKALYDDMVDIEGLIHRGEFEAAIEAGEV